MIFNMKNTFKKLLPLISDLILVMAVSLTPILWFGNDTMVIGHDSGYPLDPVKYFVSRLFTWRQDVSLGNDYSQSMGSLFFHGIQAIFVYLGFSVQVAQQINFVFWFLAMGLSMYFSMLSIKKVFSYRYFPLISTLLYLFNFHLLDMWKIGAGTTFSIYTALPAVTVLFIQAISQEISIFRAALFMALVFMVFNGGGGFGIPLFGCIFISLLTAFIYFSKIRQNEKILHSTGKMIILFLYTVLFLIVLNAYWIVPFVHYAFFSYTSSVAASGGLSGVKGWTQAVSQSTSLSNLFRLQGFPDWYNNIKHVFSDFYLNNILAIAGSFVFSVLAYISLLLPLGKKQKILVGYFGILSLVSLFFTAGMHKPTGILYEFLMNYVPGFIIFRSPQYKFMPALFFSYSVLISITVNFFINRIRYKAMRTFLTGMVILLVLIYHFPFFSNAFFVWNNPMTLKLKVPDYINDFLIYGSKYLNTTDRLFTVPKLNDSWGIEAYTWGLWAPQNIFTLMGNIPAVQNDKLLPMPAVSLVNSFYDELHLKNTQLLQRYAELFQTPYVIVRNDMFYNLDWIPTENPANYSDIFIANNLAKEMTFGEWDIYRLPYSSNNGSKLTLRSDITEFTGPADKVSGAFSLGSDNFVLSDDLKNYKLKAVSGEQDLINGHIKMMPCSSCVLENEPDDIKINPVSILPGSKLYFIKELREKRNESKITDRKELMTYYMGLSSTRLYEIRSLINNKSPEHLSQTALDKYFRYWMEIINFADGLTESPSEYGFVQVLRKYLKSHISYLNSINSDLSNSSLKQNVFLSLEQLSFLESYLNEMININDISNTKEYQINQSFGNGYLYMDARDMAGYSNNDVVLPDYMVIDNTDVKLEPRFEASRVNLGNYDLSNVKTLKIHFPTARNLAGNYKKEYLNIRKIGELCLSSAIDNFSIMDVYKLKVKVKPSYINNAVVYIREDKDILNTSGLYPRPGKYQPITIPIIENGNIRTESYTFSSSQGAKDVIVSFCVSSNEDPSQVLDKIIVNQQISPDLYFITENKVKISADRYSVKYTRIDPTKYLIEIPKDHQGNFLVFNERFNPNWKLYPRKSTSQGIYSITETWFQKPTDEINHIPLYGFINSWKIDSDTNSYILEFYPQRLFYMGLLVTVSSLFILLVFLLFSYLKKHV